MALLESHEKFKTDYEKKIKAIQNEIDRCDEFKDKITDLELENKSTILFWKFRLFINALIFLFLKSSRQRIK